MHWSDFLGWLGCVLVLGCYLMVAIQRWQVRSLPNQVGNIIGPASISLNCWYYQAWVPLVLNAVWALIALGTLIRILRHDTQSN